MYAVILTGGKQYRVKEGDVFAVEKLDGLAVRTHHYAVRGNVERKESHQVRPYLAAIPVTLIVVDTSSTIYLPLVFR